MYSSTSRATAVWLVSSDAAVALAFWSNPSALLPAQYWVAAAAADLWSAWCSPTAVAAVAKAVRALCASSALPASALRCPMSERAIVRAIAWDSMWTPSRRAPAGRKRRCTDGHTRYTDGHCERPPASGLSEQRRRPGAKRPALSSAGREDVGLRPRTAERSEAIQHCERPPASGLSEQRTEAMSRV